MADTTLSRERAKDLQILLAKTQRDLLRTGRENLDVEVLQILCELLDAVARPEVPLFSVASERWDLTLPCGSCTH
jgi:hypothetical protein